MWTFPDKHVSNNSVLVDLSGVQRIKENCYGICSDYVGKIK